MLVPEFHNLFADAPGSPRWHAPSGKNRSGPTSAHGRPPPCFPSRFRRFARLPAFFQTGLPFFAFTSFKMWFCTLRSAMMRLSRAFSSSKARNRRASLTSIPPYLRFLA
jgi:hypothetical protein